MQHWTNHQTLIFINGGKSGAQWRGIRTSNHNYSTCNWIQIVIMKIIRCGAFLLITLSLYQSLGANQEPNDRVSGSPITATVNLLLIPNCELCDFMTIFRQEAFMWINLSRYHSLEVNPYCELCDFMTIDRKEACLWINLYRYHSLETNPNCGLCDFITIVRRGAFLLLTLFL